MSDEPAGAVGHNLKFVSRSDQGGRGDGVQINVVDGYAYVGHMFTGGISVIDVRDPRDPKYVRFIPAPPNSWFIHLQAHESVFWNPGSAYRHTHSQRQASSWWSRRRA
jgi:hypothetical protein